MSKWPGKMPRKRWTIDPYCTDAELLLIDLMDITPEEAKKRFEKLIKRQRSIWRRKGTLRKKISAVSI